MQNRSFKLGRGIALGALLLMAGISAALAQSNTTALSGIVTDATGAVMQGVTISIKNPATGESKAIATKSKGEFDFEQLTPGTYEVHVVAKGFSEEVETVELLVSTPAKLNFKLTVGTSEVVEVSTGLAQVNSTDGTLGKAFDSKQIQNLPYLANNVTYLLSLQPGVLALDSGAQSGGLNTDSRTGIVNGARQDQTNVTLDGVDNNDQTNGYAFNGALRATRESVEEFRVTTQNANADSGRSSGGQVSLVTRAGTNQYHGSIYEFYRSGIGLQNNWFTKQTSINSGTPNVPLKVLQHTYGASFGAPLIKNKLFFFGAYEGFKQASDQQVSATVPSVYGGAGLASGNVTYQVCPTVTAVPCKSSTAYKTLTPADIATLDARASDAACVPITNCVAPSSDSAALAYFKLFPLANTNSGGDGYNTGTYGFASPLPLHQITNIARLDYTLNAHQTLFVRGNLQSDNQATAETLPGQPAASTSYGNNKGIAAGHVWSINSNLTNNFRYGFIRQGSASRGTAGALPYTSFGGLSSLTATSTSTVYKVITNNFADDFTINKGRHTIQMGFNDRLLNNSRYFDSPLLSFSTISVSLLSLAAVANTGSSFDPAVSACADCGQVTSGFANSYNAAILNNAGIIERATVGTELYLQGSALVPEPAGVVPTHVYRNLEQEYYVQDQWKATSHLTLTGGLRYTYLGVPYEIYGQQLAPTFSANSFLQSRIAAAAQGSTYNTPISFNIAGTANNQPNFWTPQSLNFAPRFAFAYATADNRTSIRGGYSLAYDHFGEGIIDYYDAGTSSLLSLSKSTPIPYQNVDTNPRFTGYHNLPAGASATIAAQTLPVTPANNEFTFLKTINSVQKTPYAETFNLSVQREVVHGMTLTASYVGRIGHHLSDGLDVAQPNNLLDPVSGLTYFQASTIYDKAIDAGTSPANIANTGYFQNLFPKASYKGYTGAQAYYAFMSANRGNETAALYQFDYTAGAASSAAGQANRFFFPQTSSIYVQSTIANSNYNAFQLSARHVLKYGLEYDVNYTLSKSLDQGSSPERSAGNYIVNTLSPSQMYAPSDFDVRHNITANYNAALPFGRGKPFFNSANGFVDRIIGGWQLNGVVHYSTAFPFSAGISNGYGTNFDSSSNYVQTGPIPTGGHHYVLNATTGNYMTALNGITVAAAYANLRAAYVGETGQRNNFRADGYLSLDDGFSKSFRTFREQSFKLTAEVFNVTGSTRFNSLTTAGNSTKFGQFSTLLTAPRQMQFSGKYTF